MLKHTTHCFCLRVKSQRTQFNRGCLCPGFVQCGDFAFLTKIRLPCWIFRTGDLNVLRPRHDGEVVTPWPDAPWVQQVGIKPSLVWVRTNTPSQNLLGWNSKLKVESTHQVIIATWGLEMLPTPSACRCKTHGCNWNNLLATPHFMYLWTYSERHCIICIIMDWPVKTCSWFVHTPQIRVTYTHNSFIDKLNRGRQSALRKWPS